MQNKEFIENQLEKLKKIERMYFNTPLVELNVTYEEQEYTIYAKYEAGQMTGSIKDRLAYYIFKNGYLNGQISENTKLVEVSSGNTGIALSGLAAYLGHEITIVLPDWLSKERYKLLELYGAKLVLTTGKTGFLDAVEIAKKYKENGYFYPDQFACEENTKSHKETTAKELVEQLNKIGKSPTIFVGGVGSGGTCAGIRAYVKETGIDMDVYLLEPNKSEAIKNRGITSPKHMIQGIGDGFVPYLIDVEDYAGIVSVCDEQSYSLSRMIGKKGLSVGVSSGANMLGALKLAKEYRAKGKEAVVVTVFADCAKKYLSCGVNDKGENIKESIENIAINSIRVY